MVNDLTDADVRRGGVMVRKLQMTDVTVGGMQNKAMRKDSYIYVWRERQTGKNTRVLYTFWRG